MKQVLFRGARLDELDDIADLNAVHNDSRQATGALLRQSPMR